MTRHSYKKRTVQPKQTAKRSDQLDISIDGIYLKQISYLKYLCIIFKKIANWIEKSKPIANNVSFDLAPILQHSNILMRTTAKLSNTIFLPLCHTSARRGPLNSS
ncbi:cell division control protein 42 homolog [Plakobranchus ocellatus]|uniref:Cell division control protein 42 homolog n=1 Tax=Plakobranchus ocellatus TaxID=259542 RepID=A0AAV3YJ20_9GAST|nr:cell division control protein 42 homolog [Plakobranchus ocellatus]